SACREATAFHQALDSHHLAEVLFGEVAAPDQAAGVESGISLEVAHPPAVFPEQARLLGLEWAKGFQTPVASPSRRSVAVIATPPSLVLLSSPRLAYRWHRVSCRPA